MREPLYTNEINKTTSVTIKAKLKPQIFRPPWREDLDRLERCELR